MTTIVVDIGNARIKWARADGTSLAAEGQAAHVGARDVALAALAAALPEDVDRIVVANVAGDDIGAALTELSLRRFGVAPEFVATAREAFGVRCAYRDPSRLGVDRWVAVIAAHRAAAAAGPACVLLAGTALTLDAVDAEGLHLGGLIAPGPRIVAEALASRTRGIGATQAAATAPRGLAVLGKSTDEAVGHAALLGPAAGFDRAIALVARELGREPIVFLSGGDAGLLEPWLETKVRFEADFVLKGLLLIAAETPRPRRSANR